MWYFWKYGHLSSGTTTSWPANQSDAKLLEGGVVRMAVIDCPQYPHNNTPAVSAVLI